MISKCNLSLNIFLKSFSAFVNCSNLVAVELPESLLAIENYAFNGCARLESIEIPSSVRSIGYGAFDGCSSLKQVAIPSGITSIDEYTFFQCDTLVTPLTPFKQGANADVQRVVTP